MEFMFKLFKKEKGDKMKRQWLIEIVMLSSVVSPALAADEVRTNSKISEKSPN